MKRLLLFFFFLLIIFTTLPFLVKADEEEEIRKELETLKKALEESQKATRPLEESFKKLQDQLNQIKFKVKLIEEEIQKKENEVKKGEQVLSYQKNLLNQRVFLFYKNIKKNEQLFFQFLTGENLSLTLRNFFYQKNLIDQDKNTIIKIVLYIKNLEEKKQKLKEEKNSLAILKKDIDAQSQFLDQQIKKAKAYQEQLSKKIAELTEKQREIIERKFARVYIPRSAAISYSCKPDFNPKTGEFRSPGFSPAFGFFTFGVPHRVGMNQWGAKGRAEKGQSAEEILRFYYNAEIIQNYDTSNINIHVVGTNEYNQTFDEIWNVEEYLKHLYEVPSYWPMEVLKAQAIAARSYLLAYTDNGKNPICPSQKCQVVKKEENAETWKQAVEATRGIVLTYQGKPINAYYSSTAGGFIYSSSKDISARPWTKNAQDGEGTYQNFNDLFEKAYDRDSPLFYCNWGSRAAYNNTAWLKSEEVADIVNVILLARQDSSVRGFLYQVDAGGNVWNEEKVKLELRQRGIVPFNFINEVSVLADFNFGKTTTITFKGDSGEINFEGEEFKDWFNARAPADIQIRGLLYNVEKK